LAENIGDFSDEKLEEAIQTISESEEETEQIRTYFEILGTANIYPEVPDLANEADSYNASITKLFSKTAMEHFGKFEIKRFKNVTELDEYILRDEYGRNPY
jgi:hypothetical protein